MSSFIFPHYFSSKAVLPIPIGIFLPDPTLGALYKNRAFYIKVFFLTVCKLCFFKAWTYLLFYNSFTLQLFLSYIKKIQQEVFFLKICFEEEFFLCCKRSSLLESFLFSAHHCSCQWQRRWLLTRKKNLLVKNQVRSFCLSLVTSESAVTSHQVSSTQLTFYSSRKIYKRNIVVPSRRGWVG